MIHVILGSSMKALFIASNDPDAQALLESMQQHGLDVECAAPMELGACSPLPHSLFVVFPTSTDTESFAAVCRRLRAQAQPTALLLAIARDARQLDTLIEAGADDFLLWPTEGTSLMRRLDICTVQIQKRERDVTRSQDLVEAVRRAELGEQRFRSIVECIPELVCRYLPDGVLTYVNDAYCRAFGAKPDDLLGKSFLPLLPEEDSHHFEKVIKTMSPTTPMVISVHRAIVPGGEMRWQEWYDRGIFDDDGRLIEVVGSARDITERRNFEQALADAGNFLRDVLDAVRDPITVEGNDGKYVMVNRAFAELVGASRESLVGCPVASVRLDARASGTRKWPEISDEHEITWPAADGHLRSLFEKRAVLADRKGHHVLVSVMRDVTERKRYEAQLALSERLASLGTLAAGIAHEINNPLSYVIGNISFAVDSLDPNRPVDADMPMFAEVHKALTEAHEGAQRIARIVRDVKVFSRADRETLKLVEPLRVVETSLRMVQTNLERRATVSLEVDDVPRILANEGRLAQVTVNLLMNAMQALPERPVRDNRIVIALRADPRFVIIEVRDNGRGISEENLRRIFDPFFTTKPVGEGMGLGLSICNSIIIAHGGRIDVESALDAGSAFRIVLPVAPTPTPR